MKQRAFIPFIPILATFIACAGWGAIWVSKAGAQDKPAPQQAQTAPGQPSGDANERIARLEQRILDMQSVIATLQTFVKGGGAPAPGGLPSASAPQAGGAAGGAPSEVNIRVLALETQIRAITGQLEQISQKLGQTPAGAPALPAQPGLVATNGPPPDRKSVV